MIGHQCCGLEIDELPRFRAIFLVQRRSGSCYAGGTARPGEAWRGPVELDAARHGKVWQGGGVRPTRGKPLPATQMPSTAVVDKGLSVGPLRTSIGPADETAKQIADRTHRIAAVRTCSSLIQDRKGIALSTDVAVGGALGQRVGHRSRSADLRIPGLMSGIACTRP